MNNLSNFLEVNQMQGQDDNKVSNRLATIKQERIQKEANMVKEPIETKGPKGSLFKSVMKVS